ncbi:ABC transporter permease [Mycoplasmatota bacterium zrk1]
MRVVLKLVKRNCLNYLYDKTSIFFSLLSVLIIIFLYVGFLGELQVDSLINRFNNLVSNGFLDQGSVPSTQSIRWLVDSWILAGIVTVNSITVPLSILSDMISDTENKTLNDFLTAPISRGQIVLGYLIASWVVGIVLSLITFGLGQFYMITNGGEIISFMTLIKSILLIILSVVSFSAISFFILSFVKSVSTVGVINTLVGTLIGFLAGIYIPIGVIGETLQTVIKINPAAHTSSIFRQIFMEKPLGIVFSDAPAGTIDFYRSFYGVDMSLFGYDISVSVMILYMISIAFIFFGLSVFRLSRIKR